MANPSFNDPGTFNIRDLDTGLLVAKLHVEVPAADVAGGRGYLMHWAMVKASTGDAGWGVWARPTQGNNKQWQWEGTGETFAQFLTWMHLSTRKGNLRYLVQGAREQDIIP
ncbi:MAG: hypothetical protein Q8P18_04005 [Pseudomonadota bacterium]|nr:hypothetical protein [Pseudomonadota bacterium]